MPMPNGRPLALDARRHLLEQGRRARLVVPLAAVLRPLAAALVRAHLGLQLHTDYFVPLGLHTRSHASLCPK